MPPSPFVAAVALAVVFICAKAVIVLQRVDDRRLLALVTVTAEDVAFALLFGLAAALALRVARAGAFVWRATLVAGAAAALFAVANVPIFTALRYPVTVRMLALVGRFTDLRSSIEERIGPALIVSLVAAPVLFVLVAHRWRPAIAARRGARAAVVALALAWVVTGLALRAPLHPDSWRARSSSNPHRELIGSFLSAALLNRHVDLAVPYPPDHLDDFKPAAQRDRPALARFADRPPPRNVILVVLESVAAQYLSVYGFPHDTTPRLAAEARHALVFDRFYANAGYTSQSFTPLVAGVYPGLPWRYHTDSAAPLTHGLAQLLRDRGYRTALAAAANPEWHAMDWRARDAGFEHVLGPTELGGPKASSWGTEDGVMIDGLIRWIDADPTRPFYAIAWTDQTHDPYTLARDTVPVDFFDERKVPDGVRYERYLNAIRQADRHIGRLLDALRARGLADDTLVVVTGDHGESFGHDHEAVGHALALYEECQRVPMILWNPRLFPTGERSAMPAAHVDVNPTIVHLLGLDPDPAWQGASLFSPDHPRRAYMVLELPDYQFALADERYKYILHARHGYEQLFDLANDAREQHDLARREPEIAARMRRRVAAFVDAEERALKSR